MEKTTEGKRDGLRHKAEDLAFAIERLRDVHPETEATDLLADAVEALEAAEAALESGCDAKAAGKRAEAAEVPLYEALRAAGRHEGGLLAEGEPLAIGVDLGGTKILAAAVNREGRVQTRVKVQTGAGDPLETIVERLAEAVAETAETVGARPEQVQGVGIGAPGSINYERGEVVLAPNLGWQDVPLKSLLENRLPFQCPVHLENDVNIGTLAESRFGIARGMSHVASMFWGTGIGGGVVCDGRLLHGGDGMAAEIGHVIIDPGGARCGCGNDGCLEATASRTGISRRIRAAVDKGQATVWESASVDELRLIRSGKLRRAMRKGDKLTRRVMQQAATQVGVVAASVANVLAPEMVIVGGGVMESMEAELLPLVRKAFRHHLFSARSRSIRLVPSLLADDACILGGAALVWEAVA